MRTWIDLNGDKGESFGNDVLGRSEEAIKLISHANVACGYPVIPPGCAPARREGGDSHGY